MSCELIMTVEEMQDRNAWLKMRKTGIGGSEAAIILGLSKWKSPWDLWLEKTGQAEDEDKSDNEYIYWGNVLEDLVANRFCELTGKKVRRCGMLRNKEYPFVLADVDRLVVGENSFLECKTTASWKAEEWKDDDLPDAYYLQLQHYMLCGGYDKAYIACLIGGNKFIWKEVYRNEDDIQALLEAERYFWEHNVIAKELPNVDSSNACSEAIAKHFKGGDEEALDLTGEADILSRDIEALREDKKKLENIIAEKENKLKVLIGDHSFARSPKYNFYFKPVSRNTFDEKGLKRAYPNIHARFVKQSTYRRLYIKESKARMDD